MARLAAFRAETSTARTLLLDVPHWPGHLAGQHVDVRLTAPDGYTAQRSYSLAAPAGSGAHGDRIELTVQRVPDGEVSGYLAGPYAAGDPIEVRGPVGGWFVWRDRQPEPVYLVAGGSGVVPLMAMIRARAAAGSRAPFRLLYSVRAPEDVYYADELRRRGNDVAGADAGLDVAYRYTRRTPASWPGRVGRVRLADVVETGWPPEFDPACYVCGPTGFVEAVADILVALGHDPRRIKTERFGSSGGAG